MKTSIKFQPGYDTPRTKEHFKESYKHEVKNMEAVLYKTNKYVEAMDEIEELKSRMTKLFIFLFAFAIITMIFGYFAGYTIGQLDGYYYASLDCLKVLMP